MSVSSSHGPRGISAEPGLLTGRLRRETDPPGRPLIFLKGGVGAEAAQGGLLVPCAGQATVARGQPAGDLAPGGGKLRTACCGLALGSHGVPFPLRLSRPRGVGPGFPPRASCAHSAFLRAGGAVGPAPQEERFPGLAPSLPWTVT